MSFIQETILFLSAWVHVHLISVGSSIYSIHLISIRRCFSVEVRSCPRDMQGHSIKQIAPEFWPRQPQSFLGPPWALSACSLLHMDVFTVLPCKGDLQSHHPAVIPHLLVWAPCIHKGKEGLWGAQGTDASITVHVYMHTYMYTYRYSWSSTAPLLADSSMAQHATPCPEEHLDLPDHAFSSGTLRCRPWLLSSVCTGKMVPDSKEVQNHTANGWLEIILGTNPCGTDLVCPPSQPWCPIS